MKTLPAFTLAAAAALAAFVSLTFRFEITCAFWFGAGFAMIVHGDYARARRPVPAPASLRPGSMPRNERFGLAA